jgi:hypothetical protein
VSDTTPILATPAKKYFQVKGIFAKETKQNATPSK